MQATSSVIRLFEQQTIRPGDRVGDYTVDSTLIEALQRAAHGHLRRYLRASHQSVSFRQYVGIFALNGYVIELLPKIDAERPESAYDWLVDLLRDCGVLPTGLWPAVGLTDRREGLLRLFVEAYFAELDQLGSRRLRQYVERPPAAAPTLAGRPHWPRQAARHAGQPPAIVQSRTDYLTDHALHRYLGAALAAVLAWPLPTDLRARGRALQRAWPAPVTRVVEPPVIPPRHRDRYARGWQLAQLLLHARGAGLRAGPFEAPALLFDMNALFERYIYRQLTRHRPPEVRLQVQVPTTFWQKQYLRPDIVLCRADDRVIIDVKWKQLPQGQPEADDLRQLYVYQRFFEAGRGVLLYPQVDPPRREDAHTYAPTVLNEPHVYDCQLLFVDIVRNGRLNHDLGAELYGQLFNA